MNKGEFETFILNYVQKYNQCTVAELAGILNFKFPDLKGYSLDAKIRKHLNSLVEKRVLRRGKYANGMGRPYGSINPSWEYLYILL